MGLDRSFAVFRAVGVFVRALGWKAVASVMRLLPLLVVLLGSC